MCGAERGSGERKVRESGRYCLNSGTFSCVTLGMSCNRFGPWFICKWKPAFLDGETHISIKALYHSIRSFIHPSSQVLEAQQIHHRCQTSSLTQT